MLVERVGDRLAVFGVGVEDAVEERLRCYGQKDARES